MTKEIEHRIGVYMDGRLAMKRIEKAAARSLHEWMIVGESMVEAHAEATETLGTNRTDNLAFRREFGEILRREKLHDENGGPDKTTRSFLLKIMDRQAEVIAWHASLPKGERMAWNHPSSIWRHFDKELPKQAKPKASKTTGLTSAEEAQCVENAQIEALQKRDEKIAGLRETIREHQLTINRLNAEAVRLRSVIADMLRRLGADAVSDIPTDEEIVAAASVIEKIWAARA
jgi:hypothetical protein